jgi:predicted DNA-binding WGR domain protein
MSTREFEFKEGSSDKFWKITLEGKSTVVNFGRRGTSGQTQTKEWGSPDEARKSFDKLIAEKTKKGYVETTSGATTATAATAPRAPRAAAAAPNAGPAEPVAETAETMEAAPAAPAPAAPPISMSIERHIDLAPGDWAIATWRKPAAPKTPTPAPFDRAACDAKLRGLRFGGDTGKVALWGDSVGIPGVMSREEAHYWWVAIMSTSKEDRAEKLAKTTFDGRVSLDDVRATYEALKSQIYFPEEEATLVLSHLLTPGELAQWLLGGLIAPQGSVYVGERFLDRYRQFVAPRLAHAEAEKLRALLRPQVSPANWPADLYKETGAFVVAAALGMHDELRVVVESLPDDRYTKDDWCDHYNQPQAVIFGLGDPALVGKHMHRLRLRLKTPFHLRGWLAHTEWRALDFVADSILANKNKDDSEKLVDAFQVVKAPEAAGPMLRISLFSKAPKAARGWLEANTGHTIAGLAAVGAGRGALADAAIDQLRTLKSKGLGPAIAAAVQALPAEHRGRVQAEVVDHQEATLEPFDAKTTPAWLADAVGAVAPGKKPIEWITPAHLPPLAVEGRRLSEPQVSALLRALQASTFDERHGLVVALREKADPASADAFAWKLFERWLTEGAPNKEKWAMAALGMLGGDASVLKLTPMVRAWPGESQHPRAVLGLEVLRAIGSDTALMQLNGIAQKLKFQGLKTKAREFMEAIAKDKGLTRAELEDRVVPDFDLDERGHRVFDFGARRFHFVLGPEMKPMIRDDGGSAKLRDNLPEPGAKDDAAKAAEAIAEWKAMKKQIREVAKMQADRLEQAMVTGRRWKAADFQALILRHPLMTHLARLVLWGVFDGKALRAAFRVTEDQDCADVDDETYALPAGAEVGLVHPLQLDDGAREAWGQRFADYAIIPPFPQLGRPIHRLEKDEAGKSSLARFDKLKLPAPSLVFTLEKLGWARGTAMDAGCFDEHSRQFPAAAVTAVVSYEGTVGMGYIQPEEELTVTGCAFVDGLREPSGYGIREKQLALGDVDPIVISETLHDLTVLATKAKSA